MRNAKKKKEEEGGGGGGGGGGQGDNTIRIVIKTITAGLH